MISSSQKPFFVSSRFLRTFSVRIPRHVIIDQLLNTNDPICIQFAFQMASDIAKRCFESRQKITGIADDHNIVLWVLQHYFLNQNGCKWKVIATKAEIYHRNPTVRLKIPGKRFFEFRNPNFCFVQIIVFDFSYLPVAAAGT